MRHLPVQALPRPWTMQPWVRYPLLLPQIHPLIPTAYRVRTRASVLRTPLSFNTLRTAVSPDPAGGRLFPFPLQAESDVGFFRAQSGPASCDMDKHSKQRKRRRPDAGITMIETLMAAGILVIGSVGMLALVVADIATNNRNKIDSTQTMLAEAILEQISSTFGGITQGPGTSRLVDCAGHTWTIDTRSEEHTSEL